MILHKWENSSDEFDEWDIKDIENIGVEWACYWYETGDYEGWGYILMRHEGKWYNHYCGHCSCYGPTEDIDLREGFPSIGYMRENGSEDFNKEIECLFKIAEKHKEEWEEL